MDKFNYVIARRWSDKDNQLNCYAYHSTVFYGDMTDAKNTLEFIRGRADNPPEEYSIYKIDETPIR